jgi:hypothetical protein
VARLRIANVTITEGRRPGIREIGVTRFRVTVLGNTVSEITLRRIAMGSVFIPRIVVRARTMTQEESVPRASRGGLVAIVGAITVIRAVTAVGAVTVVGTVTVVRAVTAIRAVTVVRAVVHAVTVVRAVPSQIRRVLDEHAPAAVASPV